VSKDAFDINELGKKTIEKFYEEGRIKNFVDIFLLEEREHELFREDGVVPLAKMKGWGKKAIDNLFNAIKKASTQPLDRFLYALGIRYLGEINARTIAINYGSIENFVDKIKKAKDHSSEEYNDFIGIDGIGEKVGGSIIDSFDFDVIDNLRKYVNVTDYIQKMRGDKLEGLTLLFTGTMTSMTRQEAKAKAESLGAKVVSAISSKTDILVAGEESGSKLKKAEELKVKVINEEEWLKLIDN
jgi:DNA ligase (NAD+)